MARRGDRPHPHRRARPDLSLLIALLVGVSIWTPPRPCGGSAASLGALLARERRADVQVSLTFAPLCQGGERVELNPGLPLPPASVQKIVTSMAALDLLGPDHRFVTRVLADGPIRDGRLEGDLYVVGGGDPFLVSERLWLLAGEVAAVGLREVTGALILQEEPVAGLDSLREAEKTDSPYASPVSFLGINFNSVTFIVRPAADAGGAASVETEPVPLSIFSVRNQVRTVAADSAVGSIEVSRSMEGGRETWTLRGAVQAGSGPLRIYRAARNPPLLSGGVIHGILAQRGVQVPEVRLGKAPETAAVLVEFPSLSLGTLVRSMNLWSNNFMADLLLADLGNDRSAGSGAERIRAWLKDRVGFSTVPTLVDGCGLSPADRISAGQIVALLVWASAQEAVFPDLYASFPRPGGEGTLERRFRNGPVPALRAKTGTLGDHGVSSIAGYVDGPGGIRYAFCILQQASPESGLRVADLRQREEVWLREFVTR